MFIQTWIIIVVGDRFDLYIIKRYHVLVYVFLFAYNARAVDEYVVEEEKVARLGLFAAFFDEHPFADQCSSGFSQNML